MLGETTGTSAGGASEEGKFLRVPGTNPFFPLPHGLQGNRMLELLATHPIETYLLNTGRVGGKDGDDRSKKLKIPDTSACVKGIAEQIDRLGRRPRLRLPGGLLGARTRRPRDAPAAPALRAQGRSDDYDAIVERLKTERVAHLQQFTQLSEEIIKAVG